MNTDIRWNRIYFILSSIWVLGFQLPLFFLYDFLSTFSLLSLLSFDHFKNMIFRSSFTRHKLHTGKVLSSFCICKRTGDHNLFLLSMIAAKNGRMKTRIPDPCASVMWLASCLCFSDWSRRHQELIAYQCPRSLWAPCRAWGHQEVSPSPDLFV